jgi:hypothetical protein
MFCLQCGTGGKYGDQFQSYSFSLAN